MAYQQGFSLIELVAVVLIISILAIGVGSRFSDSSTFEAMTTRDDIVAGLFYAQQIAMARAGNANTVQFTSNGTSIDIREGGNSINNDPYPLQLPAGFTLTASTLSYNKLGRTTATTMTLSDGEASVNIQVSASGYAR